MRTHTSNAPLGADPATDAALRERSRSRDEHEFFDSTTVSFEHTTRGIRAHVKPQFPAKAPKAANLSHPFKIYQPTNFASFKQGYTFINDATGVATLCNIDTTKPTDFGANPPTCNPLTDAWRFWAVRCGQVEVRPIYSLPGLYVTFTPDGSTIMDANNWGYKYNVRLYTDGVSPAFPNYVGGNYIYKPFDDPTTETVNRPLIIAGDGSPGSELPGFLGFAIWLQINPDTSGAALPTVSLVGRTYTPNFLGQVSAFNAVGNPSPNIIPVGTIETTYRPAGLGVGYGQPMIVRQELFDHVTNRYPVATGNACNGPMNYRGTYGLVSGFMDPADLSSQIFYPGDVVCVGELGLANDHNGMFLLCTDEPKTWNGGPQSMPTWWKQVFAAAQ